MIVWKEKYLEKDGRDIAGCLIHQVDDLVIHAVVKRSNSKQHFCPDKGYDSADVHKFVKEQRYVPHKHRRRRKEPKLEECPVPGNQQASMELRIELYLNIRYR